ncbi:MAG TPA: hypothetical protein VJI75_04725 [Candidatus Nanoarchaeia archaeon]|nr:hypothetical protein [Candidatus Nanoarchaeia archaeon]
MSFMRRNVNFFLLFVIIVIVLSLVGLTTYYEKTYQNLSTSYDAKLNEINKLLENLNAERTTLNQTSYELTVRKEREGELSGQYTEVKGTLKEKQVELDQTKASLETAKNDLADTENALAVEQQKVATSIVTLAEQQSDINDLKKDKEELRDDLNAVCGYIQGLSPPLSHGSC